jgi:hypothetical protein
VNKPVIAVITFDVDQKLSDFKLDDLCPILGQYDLQSVQPKMVE